MSEWYESIVSIYSLLLCIPLFRKCWNINLLEDAHITEL